MQAKEKLWTYDEYLMIDDDKRYEVLEGELMMAPAPIPFHQAVSRNLEYMMLTHVRKKKLGVLYDAPIDVVLDPHNVLQPDIVFISSSRKDIIKEKAIHGAPDLVVEVVSPSTLSRDTVRKKKIYEKFGVQEFWLVYPDMKCVEVFLLGEEGYDLLDEGCLEGKKKVRSKVLKGFTANLEEIFFED